MNKNWRSSFEKAKTMFLAFALKLALLSLISISAKANENCLANYQIPMGQIQYHLWESSDSDLHKKIISKLEQGSIQNKYYLGTGMTETYLIKFAGDYAGVFKPYGSYWKKKDKAKAFATNPQAEVLAHELGTLTELANVPVTVFRDVEAMKGSLQLFMPRNEEDRSVNFDKQLQEMKIFDFLINNQDRRSDNIIFSGNFAVAIDHSQSFGTQKSPLSETELKTALKNLSPKKKSKLLNLSIKTLTQKAQLHHLTPTQTQALESRLNKIKELIQNN